MIVAAIKRYVVGAVFVWAASTSVAAETLSDQQVLAAVRDLSSGDLQAIEIARSILSMKVSDGDPYAELLRDMPAFSAIAVSLYETGRMETLDWGASLEESSKAFGRLFVKAGLDPAEPIAELQAMGQQTDGDAVGRAYLTFRLAADDTGMRIVGLNASSDMYHFVLVPAGVAERWISVAIGENQYIEDSDWQFLPKLEAAGVAPRSTGHPSGTEKLAPEP